MGSAIKERMVPMILEMGNEEVVLEMLGIMSYAKIGKEWTDIILANESFLDFLEKTLIDGLSEDDVIMNAVMVIGNICQEAESCSLIERK